MRKEMENFNVNSQINAIMAERGKKTTVVATIVEKLNLLEVFFLKS